MFPSTYSGSCPTSASETEKLSRANRAEHELEEHGVSVRDELWTK